MARKRKTETTNTAPSPKRTTRATSSADKATSSGGVQNDATAEVDEAQKHPKQVSSPSKSVCLCLVGSFMGIAV